jgi:cell division GTPase FtsZ
MQGEVRVTVIATGFDRAVTGDPHQRQSQNVAPGVLSFPSRRTPVPPPSVAPAGPRSEPRKSAAPPAATDVPDMEIPTFIRRQMD